MSEDLVLIRQYTSETAAEMDKGLLASVEIDAMVVTDDAGGAYPQFRMLSKGIRLFVRPEQADEAREVLEAGSSGGTDVD